MRCHFCTERPVVRVRLSRGCLAFPSPQPVEQVLCLHHAMRATPRGTIDVLEVLPGVPAWDRGILARRYPEVLALTQAGG